MEADLMRRIQISLSTVGARVFRNNVGLGWIGKSFHIEKEQTIKVYPGDVVIRAARPLHAGLIKDSADLIGFATQGGKFVSCEVKVPGEKPSKEQFDWLAAVNAAGGIAIWADSPDSAISKYMQAIRKD